MRFQGPFENEGMPCNGSLSLILYRSPGPTAEIRPDRPPRRREECRTGKLAELPDIHRHWSINGRFLTQRITGVQRHGHEVLHALDSLRAEGHALARGVRLDLLVPAATETVPDLRTIAVRRVGRMNGHAWEQGELPFYSRGGILSLCNTSTVLRRRQIVCVHDVNTLSFPQSYAAAFRAFYRVLLPTLGHVAARVATVSRYSAEQLIEHGVVRRDRVVVIPNGHDHALRWRPRHGPATQAAAGPDTVVIVGSPAPHKNVGMILRLAQLLSGAGIRIAVVGRIDAHVFANADFGPMADNIVWLGAISDDEMAALLGDCLCLVFPSFVEGFGFPPLEAMALGCPVISSDRASMPEVCGDAVLYAAPDDPAAWGKAILSLRNDAGLRARLAVLGKARAGLFTWRRAAEIYLETMATIDGVAAANAAPPPAPRSA